MRPPSQGRVALGVREVWRFHLPPVPGAHPGRRQMPRVRQCAETAHIRAREPRPISGQWERGVVLAAVTGAIWGFLFFEIIRVPFLPWIATVGVGFLIGEGISVSVNRKRGRDLQYIAGACMALSYVVAGFVSPFLFVISFGNLFLLLSLAIAVFMAASRVK